MRLAEAIKNARKVLVCGNGGSAANAIHWCNDLLSVGIRAHALTADVSTITAIANDFGYGFIFERQLAVLGDKGDLLIALSGSGNSPNILRAIIKGQELGMKTWAIVGEPGGKARGLADECTITGRSMQEAENAQLALGHEAMLWLRQNMKALT